MQDIFIKRIHNPKAGISLVWEVFLEYEAPDYAEEGIKEFYHSIHDEAFLQQLCMYGAFLDEMLVGVIATRKEGSHIALCFVDGTYHKQGIGRKLFQTVKSNCNIDKMTVNASPFAVSFYTKMEFIQIDKEQIVNGIRFTPMELCLF